jgi:hypothetical protein
MQIRLPYSLPFKGTEIWAKYVLHSLDICLRDRAIPHMINNQVLVFPRGWTHDYVLQSACHYSMFVGPLCIQLLLVGHGGQHGPHILYMLHIVNVTHPKPISCWSEVNG